ncbi:hypothetical protein BKA80DRAFT_265307 [Phyllosticta citrichinensis]
MSAPSVLAGFRTKVESVGVSTSWRKGLSTFPFEHSSIRLRISFSHHRAMTPATAATSL